MKEDHELLDQALDAAIVELDNRSKSSDEAPDPKEAETPDEPAGNDTPETTEEKETDLDQEANAESTQEVAQATPDASPSIDAPAFWSTEQKALFAKAPRELQQVIAQRELTLQQQLSRLANESKNGKGIEQRFYADFESPEAVNLHKAKLQAQGISDPVSELHRYRAWDRVLEADPHTAIAKLMKQNGLTPYDFTNEAVEPENQYQDPRVDDAIKRAEAAEARIKEWETKQEQQRLGSLVNTYKQGTFEDGSPRAKFMAVYAPQITQAYTALSNNPDYQHLPETDILHYATEYVRSQVNEFHGVKAQTKQEAPKKTREQIIEEGKKAELAATATTGAPNTGSLANKRPRLKGKTDSERLDNALDIAIERHSAAF